MPSEDFSYVLREVPGTYMMLGARRDDVPEEAQADNHSPFVVFDDSVLGDQAGAAGSPWRCAGSHEGSQGWRGSGPTTGRGTETAAVHCANHQLPTFHQTA